MRDGDLSNRVTPRVLIVFEGAIGVLLDEKKFGKYMRKAKYAKAMQCWGLNDIIVRRLLWLYWQKDITIEVVTFLGNEFCQELNTWLNDTIVCHRIWATDPYDLGRKIAYMNDLACIYDPEPERWLMYGAKGRFLDSVTRIGEGL